MQVNAGRPRAIVDLSSRVECKFAASPKRVYNAPMRQPWKKVRYQLEWLGLLIAAKVIPLLPRRICFYLGQIFGALASVFDWRGRKVALSNLEAAFGDRLSIFARRRIVRQSYQYFVRSMIDLFWTPRLTKDNFWHYIHIENLEQFHKEVGPSKTAIAASMHYGNFEWLSLALGFIGYPAEVVTKEFKNPLLNPVFKKVRGQFGHNIVPREGAIVRLYKTLRRGGSVAILVDLWLHPNLPSVAIDCFGLKACVTMAHAWLHEKTGAPILPAHCEPLPNGRYRIVAHPKVEIPPGATYEQIAQACWDVFEPVVRKNPAPWLWMYKYWRYKPAATRRRYPFYARESRRFEKLLARAAENPARPASR